MQLDTQLDELQNLNPQLVTEKDKSQRASKAQKRHEIKEKRAATSYLGNSKGPDRSGGQRNHFRDSNSRSRSSAPHGRVQESGNEFIDGDGIKFNVSQTIMLSQNVGGNLRQELHIQSQFLLIQIRRLKVILLLIIPPHQSPLRRVSYMTGPHLLLHLKHGVGLQRERKKWPKWMIVNLWKR